MFLLPSLSNMINYPASRWVGGQSFGVLGVRGFNKTQEKNIFGVAVLSVHFGRGLFFLF